MISTFLSRLQNESFLTFRGSISLYGSSLALPRMELTPWIVCDFGRSPLNFHTGACGLATKILMGFIYQVRDTRNRRLGKSSFFIQLHTSCNKFSHTRQSYSDLDACFFSTACVNDNGYSFISSLTCYVIPFGRTYQQRTIKSYFENAMT